MKVEGLRLTRWSLYCQYTPSNTLMNMGGLDSLASINYSLARTLLDDLPHTGIDSSRDL